MATGIVQCDHCQRVVKQEEAHGWLDVRVYVTKPDNETLERMKQDPTIAKLLDARGVTAAELPALIGGDFCCVDHLVKFYEAQRTLEEMHKPPEVEKDATYAEKEAAFEDWYRETKEAEAPDAQPDKGWGV